MRVLHIWNTAGVASIIAKYQSRLLGWRAWVLTRKRFDPFGFTVYGEALNSPSLVFMVRSVLSSREYEVVHVHDLDVLVPLIKRVSPGKVVIIHYHGTSIRGRWYERERYWRAADHVLVSTPDLLEGAPREAGVEYLPNPVDTELFKPIPGAPRRAGSALFIYGGSPKYRGCIGWARGVASRLGLRLTMLDRDSKPVPYKLMPLLLNKFEYFIDRCWVPSLSKTALEALACGLRVVRWDGRVVSGLPEPHKPESVVRRLERTYRRLLNP